jgi:hypothetical protein
MAYNWGQKANKRDKASYTGTQIGVGALAGGGAGYGTHNALEARGSTRLMHGLPDSKFRSFVQAGRKAERGKAAVGLSAAAAGLGVAQLHHNRSVKNGVLVKQPKKNRFKKNNTLSAFGVDHG